MSLTKASYAMINGAPLNVLDFGAYNDATNPTATAAAIQAAVDACPEGSGQVYFPICSITSGVTPVKLNPPS